jgi:hypothetical protein
MEIEDGAELHELLDWWVEQQMNQRASEASDAFRMALRMPWTLGLEIKDKRSFAIGLDERLGRDSKTETLPDYRGVPIRRERIRKDSRLAKLFTAGAPVEFYHALLDDAWYASRRQASLKGAIDRHLARRSGHSARTERIEGDACVCLCPAAANKARDALHSYLEWESHRRALVNSATWYALYRSGLIDDSRSVKARQAAALRYLGYVPVSPDGAAYAYEPRTDDVVNRRHGSLRRPQLHAAFEPASPLGQILDDLRSVRADVRLRPDGLHTVVTIERKP